MGASLSHLPLINRCARKKKASVLMEGLDAAGKTTILYRLKLGELVTTIPTIGFNLETIKTGKLDITAWDVGGRCGFYPLIRHYYGGMSAIIYTCDCNDIERLEELRNLFSKTCRTIEDYDNISAVLILANKQDIPGAISPEKLGEVLEVDKVKKQSKKTFGIFPTVATTGEGLEIAFEWLSDVLRDRETKGLIEQTRDTFSKAVVAVDTQSSSMSSVAKWIKKVILY